MTARRHRRFSNKDEIHDDVIKAYKKFGVIHRDLSHVGDGISDLLATHKRTREVLLIELKSGDGKRGDLTEAQEKFHKLWPVIVACSVVEALRAVGIEVGNGAR